MASQRSGGYTTSGRSSGGKSSAKPVAKKASAPAKKSTPPKKASSKPAGKSKFADTMNVPGSARPKSGVAEYFDSFKSKKSVPATGRDRFGPKAASKASFGRPGANRQEGEAKIMSAMFRDRLGPGQR